MNNSDKPAMPTESVENDGAPYYKALPSYGLTKREHFAAMAMAGILANPITTILDEEAVMKMVLIADKVLEELEKS